MGVVERLLGRLGRQGKESGPVVGARKQMVRSSAVVADPGHRVLLARAPGDIDSSGPAPTELGAEASHAASLLFGQQSATRHRYTSRRLLMPSTTDWGTGASFTGATLALGMRERIGPGMVGLSSFTVIQPLSRPTERVALDAQANV